MATAFPTSKDNLTNPSGSDELTGHAAQHANANDAIEALETAVGVTNSTDSNSLTYKVNALSSELVGISNTSDAITELLGLDGNNDLEVNGIENATNVDSFAKASWRTVNYKVQVKKGVDVYTSEITAIHDGTDILVSESNIVSTTSNTLFTYTFEENSGIISLRVTPNGGSITFKYYRTAIKA
jgi:hypothetical protein